MTPEEHKARHAELHKILHEIVVGYTQHNGVLPSIVNVLQLMTWSSQHEIAGRHKALDELVADYLSHNRRALPSTTNVMELVRWSLAQTPDAESQK